MLLSIAADFWAQRTARRGSQSHDSKKSLSNTGKSGKASNRSVGEQLSEQLELTQVGAERRNSNAGAAATDTARVLLDTLRPPHLYSRCRQISKAYFSMQGQSGQSVRFITFRGDPRIYWLGSDVTDTLGVAGESRHFLATRTCRFLC